ncbi:MAG: class II fructose-bisphosphatase [Hyphomicrobiales bacterium]|nr:class II fructose-bisphosphatase [Hyphomicrobiales bacterium]MCY4037921.1 class II fructose-bisphosphatase [Hyphomicrobiales bacterium]
MAAKKQKTTIDRILTLELVRVTESAAIAASKHIGHGREKEADQAAVDAMRRELNYLDINGEVVIGEGERDEAPMLFIGEKVGTGKGPKLDIALDPLEGTTLTAKAKANAMTVIAMARRGALLHAPDVYMDKIAVGPGYPPGLIDLDASPKENIARLADAKGVAMKRIRACILDRPRHADLIRQVRECGVSISLISDGDIAGIIHTTEPSTGIDIYMGIGGAPEGVLAAAALRCIGGQMQGRLVISNAEQKERAKRMGIEDVHAKIPLESMVGEDVFFSATGVTDGSMLAGVRRDGKVKTTHSIVMRSSSGTVRWVRTRHGPGINKKENG